MDARSTLAAVRQTSLVLLGIGMRVYITITLYTYIVLVTHMCDCLLYSKTEGICNCFKMYGGRKNTNFTTKYNYVLISHISQ